jgi:hypothetical protein
MPSGALTRKGGERHLISGRTKAGLAAANVRARSSVCGAHKALEASRTARRRQAVDGSPGPAPIKNGGHSCPSPRERGLGKHKQPAQLGHRRLNAENAPRPAAFAAGAAFAEVGHAIEVVLELVGHLQ